MDQHENIILLVTNISLVLYLHDTEEAMGMREILAHDIRMKKNPQNKEDTFWIFTDFHGVMRAQSPVCTPARKFHQCC